MEELYRCEPEPMPVMFLLWDHDGVLVDTERWYFEATKLVLNGIRGHLSKQLYLESMAAGRSCWELAQCAGASAAQIRELRTQRDAVYQGFLQTKPIEIPSVHDVLSGLAGQYRMAIVTTARRTDFELIHADRDLLRHFEFTLTVEDYERCKPAPDPYLAAMARFRTDTSRVLALEDSARGLRSAQAAGIRCIVIRNSFTMSQDFAGAFRMIDSVSKLPEVLARMARASAA
jgi:HAD superfamily hydrolase (TIGR01509 family)